MESNQKQVAGNINRYIFSLEAIDKLEVYFFQTPYPTREQRFALAADLQAPHQQIKNWFQNRRARYKKQQQKAAGLLENPLFAMKMQLKTFYKQTNTEVTNKKKSSTSQSERLPASSSLLANLVHQRPPSRLDIANVTQQPLDSIITCSACQLSCCSFKDAKHSNSFIGAFQQPEYPSPNSSLQSPTLSGSDSNMSSQQNYYPLTLDQNCGQPLTTWSTLSPPGVATGFAYQVPSYFDPLSYSITSNQVFQQQQAMGLPPDTTRPLDLSPNAPKPLDLSLETTRRLSSTTPDFYGSNIEVATATNQTPNQNFRRPSTPLWQLLSNAICSPTQKSSVTNPWPQATVTTDNDHYLTEETSVSHPYFPKQSTSTAPGRTSSPNCYFWHTPSGDPFPRYLQSVGSLSDVDQSDFIAQILQADAAMDDDVFKTNN